MNKRRVFVAFALAAGLGVTAVATALSANAAQGEFIQIVNSISGKCADVEDVSLDAGARVHQWSCHNDDNQLWLPVNQGDGYVKYVNKHSGLCLAASVLSNSSLTQQGCALGGYEQRWRWGPADDAGHLVLQNGLGNFCLAHQGVYSARNGWQLEIHDCATTSGQFWHAG